MTSHHLSLSQRPLIAWSWLMAWCLLSVAHTAQSIIFSGFTQVPGDPGDARFNNFTLEHIYAWLTTGAYSLWSPGIFHPTLNALAYSDNHFGTAFLYILPRLAGFDIMGSFQLWMLACCALNALTMSLVLKRWGTPALIIGPLVFLSTSSNALLQQIGHPQVLPLFSVVLTLHFWMRTLWRPRPVTFMLFILSYTYMHLCYMYYGALGTFIILFMLISTFLVSSARKKYLLFLTRRTWASPAITLGSILACLIVLSLVYLPYALHASAQGTRSMSEIQHYAPDIGSWFSAGSHNYLFPSLRLARDNASFGETSLFIGFLPYILTAFLLTAPLLSRPRHLSSSMKISISCGLSFLFCMLFFTTWTNGSEGGFWWLAETLDAFRAFRAFGRIILPMTCLLALFIGLSLRNYSGISRPTHVIFAILLSLSVIENLNIGQPSFSKKEFTKRADNIAHTWNTTRPHQDILCLAVGDVQPFYVTNLDAWHAALLLRKSTLNGYSGNCPPSHHDFQMHLDTHRAKRLISSLDISPDNVFITNKYDIEAIDRENAHKSHITTSFTRLSAKTGNSISVPSLFHNRFCSTIDDPDVFCSYRIYDMDGHEISSPPSVRTRLPNNFPGDNTPFALTISSPLEPGIYQAKLSLVREGVLWYRDAVDQGSTISILVDSLAATTNPTALTVSLKDDATITCSPGSKFEISVEILNLTGTQVGHPDSRLNMGYRHVRPPVSKPTPRTPFPILDPYEHRSVPIAIVAPDKIGSYLVQISPVYEGICWVHDTGGKGALVTLKVK